jgi:hypothetical protein
MAHQEGRPVGRRNENVLNFARSSAPGSGARALDLVYQAAEVFSGIEDSAREIEARAKAMCKDATERLRHAEQRVASAEHTLREVVVDADGKLQDASRALTQAETRISAAEARARAAEVRAHAAEAEAHEAKQALALVEEAIRRRLLCASPEAVGRLRDVA